MITYIIFRFWVMFLSVLPFSVIYKLSDGVAYLLQHVVKYRTKVIYENLKLSFPDKGEQEIQRILKASFVNLSDIILETLKGMSMSYKQIQERYTFVNKEVIDHYYSKGQAVIGTAGHLGNWEWATRCIGMSLEHDTLGVTKKINNPYIHKFIQKKRTEEKVEVADIPEAQSAFANNKDKATLFILIADQSPHKVHNSIWIDFLNRKTPFLHGPETYSKKYNLPILFMPIVRIARGRYEVRIELLEAKPRDAEKGEITAKFASRLEDFIQLNPEQWLWSHNRWKRAHLYEESKKKV